MVFKMLSTAVAAGAIAIGTYGYNQWHGVYVELNQTQAELRTEQARNAAISAAAADVVTATSHLEEVLSQNSDKPAKLAPLATSSLASAETVSPEPPLADAQATPQ